MWHIIRSFKGQKLWLRHLFKMCANLSNLFYICQLSIKWSYILSCILLFITAQCFVGKKKRDIFFLCKTSFLNWTIISFFFILFYIWYIYCFLAYDHLQSNFGPSNSDQSNTMDGSNWCESPVNFPYTFVISKLKKKPFTQTQIPRIVKLNNNKITSFIMPNWNMAI